MTPDSGRLGLLARIGALRDGLLVAASILYGLGYLVWSMYAWEHRLGLLPALDAQYFIAGIFPALIGLAGFYVFRPIIRTIERFLVWQYSKPKTHAKRMTERVAYAVAVGPALLLAVSKLSGRLKHAIEGPLWSTALMGLFIVGTLFYSGPRGAVASRFSRFYRVFQVGNVVLIAVLVGIAYFMHSVYPQIPQELGGVRPRCVYVDLDTAKLSSASLSPLLGAEQQQPSRVVARSLAVELLYSSRDVLLVRAGGKAYELDRAAVHTIASCE